MYNWGMENYTEAFRQGPNDETSCLTYSVRELSGILDVSESTLRRMIRDGEFRCVRFRKRIRIPKSGLDDFLRGNAGKEAA